MTKKRQVFVSYSHEDVKWLNRLRKFLRPLERDAELLVWSDTDIKPSSNWRADIQTAITDADAAILLISQDFLASDYVASDELPQILSAASERGLRIFPVIVSACFLRNSPLTKFQALNPLSSPLDSLEPAEQNRILTKLAESIDDLLKVAAAGVTDEWLEKFRSQFVPVDGGTAILGDNELYDKLHALQEHEVEIESFRLGQYAVTQSEWIAVMNTQPWLNAKNVRYGSEIPAIYVNWGDAIDFITRINRADSKFRYRLPTESEWEYAARGGCKVAADSRTKFCFGNDLNQLMQHGWYDQNASLRGNNYAHAVGQLSPNQLGLYDMHGNIWEWTVDDFDGLRSLRGGGFNFTAEGACSAFRVVQKPETKSEAAGFRLVQEPRSEQFSRKLRAASSEITKDPKRTAVAETTNISSRLSTSQEAHKVLSGQWKGEYSGFRKGDSYLLNMELRINQAVDDQISGELIFSGSQNSNLTVTGGQSPGPDVFAASADLDEKSNLL
ncbi:MAG: SUMF1/EgtB/PvdO family nonheme iron enzyme, partial [Leptolyngbya sp. SIO4C1]|nr:SUMF1/EgtB/PvdO family nonheme iron enzyme [Leptolyngbya sp. SIO4C1]